MGVLLLCLLLFSPGLLGHPLILEDASQYYDEFDLDLDDLQLKTEEILRRGLLGLEEDNDKREDQPIKTSLEGAVAAAVQPFGRQMMGPLGTGGSYTVKLGEDGRVTIDFFPGGEMEKDEEMEKKPAKHSPKWAYVGSSGIEYWGKVDSKCLGKEQSPINIDITLAEKVGNSGDLMFSGYDMVDHKNTKLKNNGHTTQLDVVSGSPTLSGGLLSGSYRFAQLHFHWGATDSIGSEHTLNRARFPLEMHLVHISNDIDDPMNVRGGLAVAGFFFEISSSHNPQMQAIIEQLKHITQPKTDTKLKDPNFNVEALISPAHSGNYFSYDGSLTTPGCNEVVQWLLFQTPLKISKTQMSEFRTLMDKEGNMMVNNFRPIQPLHSREIGFSGGSRMPREAEDFEEEEIRITWS